MQLKIKTPAKINLTLEVLNKRDDGFHNIQSVMQMINLYDYLTIDAEESDSTQIILSGTSDEIPYDESNLVYKAAILFLTTTNIKSKINIHIEKHIPVSAGLAGGSTNASGTLFGLNKIFNEPLSDNQIHKLCETLGSDLNVCKEGGCVLATSRGEKIEKLITRKYKLSLIKPLNLGISAKEAYTKYSKLENKSHLDMTSKMINAIKINTDITQFLYNDLETAVFNDCPQLQKIKQLYPKSIMSGSGSTYFVLTDTVENIDGYWVKSGLEFIDEGVSVCQ